MQKSSRTFTLVLTLSTLYSLGVGLLGPIYPIFVVNRFSASILDIGALYAIFYFVAAISKIGAGKLVDAYGKERIFFLGVMIGAICSAGYVYALTMTHLWIIEFFFGISHALQRPSLLALVVDLSDEKRRGTVLGMFESVYDITEAVSAILSTLIASKIGFETLFFLCSGCQATTGIVVLKKQKIKLTFFQ